MSDDSYQDFMDARERLGIIDEDIWFGVVDESFEGGITAVKLTREVNDEGK